MQESRVADLWEVPEFRQFCRPPQAEANGPIPGLVIEFPTEIIFGNNLFGWPLGGGDFAYDPTNFATKVRAAGVWFEGYNNAALSVSPRVYLVPAGMDIMTIPNSLELETRTWNIVDQSIPPPFAARARRALLYFTELLEELSRARYELNLLELLDLLLDRTGYAAVVQDVFIRI